MVIMVIMVMVGCHGLKPTLVRHPLLERNGRFSTKLVEMTTDDSPTLADDEAALAGYARALADAFEQVALPWLAGLVERRSPGTARAAETELEAAADAMVHELQELLAVDIADQVVGPLQLVRRAIRVPTDVLSAAGVAPVGRDPFAERNFPQDVYDLTPASFADIDPSLHEPGLVWGAAKAHVHLRRRRESAAAEQARGDAGDGGRVVALSVDLIDRSKISAAYAEATLVRSTTKLLEAAADASLVLVDLARVDDIEVLRDIDARTVAYGSHVDDARLDAATAAGAEAIPRSVFFRRLEQGGV